MSCRDMVRHDEELVTKCRRSPSSVSHLERAAALLVVVVIVAELPQQSSLWSSRPLPSGEKTLNSLIPDYHSISSFIVHCHFPRKTGEEAWDWVSSEKNAKN